MTAFLKKHEARLWSYFLVSYGSIALALSIHDHDWSYFGRFLIAVLIGAVFAAVLIWRNNRKQGCKCYPANEKCPSEVRCVRPYHPTTLTRSDYEWMTWEDEDHKLYSYWRRGK